MPALSFQKQFVPKIRSGEKEHTIRGWRKRAFVTGDLLALYYGMRTKQCELLMRRTCTHARPIVIANSGRKFPGWDAVVDGKHQFGLYPQIEIDGTRLADDEMESLARRDGFVDLFAMAQFWDLTKPFSGQIVHWRFDEPEVTL